jgi:t-SNARE complex subunit (syntaxin)
MMLGKGAARIYNLISLIFLILTIVVVVLVVTRLG